MIKTISFNNFDAALALANAKDGEVLKICTVPAGSVVQLVDTRNPFVTTIRIDEPSDCDVDIAIGSVAELPESEYDAVIRLS